MTNKARHGHEVEIASELDAGVDLRLLLHGLAFLVAVLLAVLSTSTSCVDARSLPLSLLVGMSVVVSVPLSPGSDPQALVHRHEDHETHEDAHAQEQVSVRLHQHQPHPLRLVLAHEDLRQQVEQRVAQQAAHGEGDHDRQRGRVDVGRAQREEEVGRARDVQRGQQGVDRWAAGEEDAEEACGEGRRRGGVVGELCGIEVLDNRARLPPPSVIRS